jgi:hypothetical protein
VPEKLRVAFATACGDKKESGHHTACDLYKSPRIKALCSRRHEFDFPLYILSAEYGLVHCDAEIDSYNRLMTDDRARELAPTVASVMHGFDWLVFFKAGANGAYARCIRLAAHQSGVSVALVGVGFMGHWREALDIARQLRDGIAPQVGSLSSLEVYAGRSIA